MSMYDFLDVNERSPRKDLPAEALKINGEYIENQIAIYRTLSVTGRELLASELKTFETGIRDGSVLQSRRLPSREITVRFQIVAVTNAQFRAAFNRLNEILNVEEAELIFADEPDKFFIGTPQDMAKIEGGRNSVIGEFTLFCADPLKYSTALYSVTIPRDTNSVAFDYNGTYRTYPQFEADFYKEAEYDADGNAHPLTGNGDCGYVAFFDDRGNIIQLGDPDEMDKGVVYEKSQTLIMQEFSTQHSWVIGTGSLWQINGGSVFPNHSIQTGSVGMKPGSYDGSGNPRYYYLSAANYGSSADKWHGPSITRTIPADATGDQGASNFLVSYRHKMCISGSVNADQEYGDFQVQLVGADNKVVAGARVCKWKSGKTGTLQFYVNGKWMQTMDKTVDLSQWNAVSGRDEPDIPTSWIRKTGSEIVFNMLGCRQTFYDSTIKDKKAVKMTIMFGAFADKPPLAYNGLFWIKFVKDNCDTYGDVPNKFSANDVVIADGKNGEIFLNNVSAPELGALGNDWETFYLQPGTNNIGISYSDWVQSVYAPTCKIKYREAFL